jgi:hypothetical protein
VSNGRIWKLPTQKGTELFPVVTQPPTKLVIQGVEAESPLYHVIAGHFAGQLKQFHAGAQQQYALSNTAQLKLRKEWLGARAIYVNQGGQETLTLQVAANLVEELEKSIDVWDWAIINFKIFDPPSAARMAAFMTTPLLQKLTPDLVTAKGVTVADGPSGAGDKPISFPNTDHFTSLGSVVVDSGYTASSLSVDLRVAAPEAEVVIDVYGRVEGARACFNQEKRLPLTYTLSYPTNAPTAGAPVGWHVRGNLFFRLPDCSIVQVYFYLGTINTVWSGSTDFATLSTTKTIDITEDLSTEVTFSAVQAGASITITVEANNDLVTIFGDWNPDVHDVSFGASSIGHTADGWFDYTIVGFNGSNGWFTSTFDAAVTIAYSTPAQSGEPPANDGGQWTPVGTDNQLSYNLYFVGALEPSPGPTADDAEKIVCDMTVSARVGKGEPDWVYSTHSTDYPFFAWESKRLFPDPLKTAVVSTNGKIATTTLTDDTVYHHYGLPYLGRLLITRRDGDVRFHPAPV